MSSTSFKDPRPFRKEGLLWLKASAAYEIFDKSIIPDKEWDDLTLVLLRNYEHLDPYLKWSIPVDCLVAGTASGVRWNRGLAKTCLEGLLDE